MIKQKLHTKGDFRKRVWVVALIFAAFGAYVVYRSLASPYHPYNPPSDTGIATYYNNASVGGRGHCAAIHYARGKRLKVTNKKVGTSLYGTSITCTVSDAGPFGNGRVVDLNTDDFRKLAGSTSLGVLPVRLDLITATKPQPKPNPKPKPQPKPKPSSSTRCASDTTSDRDVRPEGKCRLGSTIPSVEEQKPTVTPTQSKNVFGVVFDFIQGIFEPIIRLF